MLKRGIMAIYKSSFNQKPEKQEKPKKEKVEKIKLPKEKSTKKKFHLKPNVFCAIISIVLFVVCCFPSNFLKNFLLGIFGLSTYPLTLLIAFFSLAGLRKTKFNVKKKYVTYIAISMCLVWFILHLILTMI